MPPRSHQNFPNTELLGLTKLSPDQIEAALNQIDPQKYVEMMRDSPIQDIQDATARALRLFEKPMKGEFQETLKTIRNWIQLVSDSLVEELTPPSFNPGLANKIFSPLLKCLLRKLNKLWKI